MVAKIVDGSVTLYSRNGKVIRKSYSEIAKVLEGVKADAVIGGELVALYKSGVSHFQLLQNALRREARLISCSATATIYASSRCLNAKRAFRLYCRIMS
jgi:bifunctional non-homologous end joining protein LigD